MEVDHRAAWRDEPPARHPNPRTTSRAYRLKSAATLDALDKEADRFESRPDIGQIAIASALSHLDFRFAADTWREGRPRLARWRAEFAKRPSMRATEHADTY